VENRRLILIALIGVVLFLLYQAWQTDYRGAPAASSAAGSAAAPQVSAAAPDTESQARVRVHTDVLDAQIALSGGELRRVSLSQYPEDRRRPQDKLALLDDRADRYFTLQSGLAGTDQPLTDVHSAFQAERSEYRLAEGATSLDVPLTYRDAQGYVVRKVFHFERGSYLIGFSQTLINDSGRELQASPYLQLWRSPPDASERPRFVPTFLGVGVYEQPAGSHDYRFEKVSFKDLDKRPYESHQTGGWIAMLQHYFIAALLPPQDASLTFTSKFDAAKNLYLAQYVAALQPVAAGAQRTFVARAYVGPVLQTGLAQVAPGFELTEDYGLLTPIAKPLFWVLALYHRATGNWGWAIVLLTLSVRILFFPLTAAQYRSMAKMRKFAPRIQELRERYADDRERLNKAMMDLYKKEGFNPLAGCWPLLIQLPIFYALYWVLVQSVELRQAPFILWWQDLSAADPYYVLPVLYGASMWLQQRLSGQTATMDPTQQKIMNVMPIALTGLFLFFPVGLVLYWLVSNLVNILQQWLITRRLEKEGLARR
jgi:YidC/Oxa1 family membrane protein insertase